MRAISITGYFPNRLARNLREQSARILALVVSDISNPFFTAVLHSFDDRARTHGYSVIVTNTDERVDLESQRLLQMISEGVAGIVLASTGQSSEGLLQAERSAIPVVALDRRIEGRSFDTVTTDGFAAARQAVTYMINAGHDRIGLIGGPTELSTMAERKQGYETALNEHGVPVQDALMQYGDLKEDSGLLAASKLLEQRQPPTALLVASNLMAIGALRALRERKLTVPDKVSIICFDDVVGGDLIGPGIGAVLQPTSEMGATAADLVRRRIEDPSVPPEVRLLKADLLPRGSVAAPPEVG